MAQKVDVKGVGIVEFPDGMPKESMLQALRRKFTNAGKRTIGAAEGLASIASSAIAEPVSGLAGIAGAALTQDSGKATDWIKATQDALTYQPRTETGQARLQDAAKALAPIGEVIQGASQNLGDKTYDATNSPMLAALAYSAPTALMEGLGVKGLRTASKPVSGADLYSARMGFGNVDDKWGYLTKRWSENPETQMPTKSGVIQSFDMTDDDGIYKQVVFKDDNGDVVGTLFAGEDVDGKMVGSVEVRPDQRRKGIATEMYNYMERITGKKMKPAEKNSADAQAFWGSRQPSMSNLSAANVSAPKTPKQITESYESSGVKSSISERTNQLILNKVIVPQEDRGSGVGSAFMKELVDYADATGKPIALTPSADFGGSKPRLVEFYKRFGFVENKGKNKDYEISEAMYRPVKSTK